MLERIGQDIKSNEDAMANKEQDIEKMLDCKVNLKVWVKVKEDWLNNDSIVNKFKLS